MHINGGKASQQRKAGLAVSTPKEARAIKHRILHQASSRGRLATRHFCLRKSGPPLAIRTRHSSEEHAPGERCCASLPRDDTAPPFPLRLNLANKLERHIEGRTSAPQPWPEPSQDRRPLPASSSFASPLRSSSPSNPRYAAAFLTSTRSWTTAAIVILRKDR